jgi:hypothetical protein
MIPKWRAGLIALPFAAGVAVTGCTVLLDSGDYKVGSLDASSDSLSNMETATADGSVDVSQPLDDGSAPDVFGDENSLEDSGARSDSGEAGREQDSEAPETGAREAGVDSGPDAAIGCTTASLPTTSAAFQAALSGCIYTAGCDPDCTNNTPSISASLFTSIGACVGSNYLGSANSLKCLESISSCAGFQTCTGMNTSTAAQCGANFTNPASCSGSLAINCGADSNIVNAVYDCAITGGTCTTYKDPNGGNATAAGCSLGTCTNTDYLSHCDAQNNLYVCVGTTTKKEIGQSCGANATCVEDANGARCVPKGGVACTTSGALSCASSSSLETCNDKVTYTENCANAGLGCETDTSATSTCVAPGCTTNDVGTCTEKCLPGLGAGWAQFCVGGVPLKVNCANYAPFTTCDDTACTGTVFCNF